MFPNLSGLKQGQRFKQFIQSAVATRELDDGLGKISKPELAHEEIMKLERQLPCNVGVVLLLDGK